MMESCGTQPSDTPQNCTEAEFARDCTEAEFARIDRLPRAWRDLINEFGWIIVRDMRLDGHLDVTRLREELDAWRERKQERWLAEIPYRRIPLPLQT